MVLVLGLASNVVLCKIGIAKPSISSEWGLLLTEEYQQAYRRNSGTLGGLLNFLNLAKCNGTHTTPLFFSFHS